MDASVECFCFNIFEDICPFSTTVNLLLMADIDT